MTYFNFPPYEHLGIWGIRAGIREERLGPRSDGDLTQSADLVDIDFICLQQPTRR